MSRWRRYPKYKPSGVEWLGEVPEGWNLQRAKFFFRKMNRPVRESDEIVTAFRDGEVTLRTKRRTEGFTNSLQEIGYQGIRKGDLVIHGMDGFAGAIGVSDSDGKSTPVYSVCVPLDPKKIDNYYYARLLRYAALSGYILSLAKGIRERSTEFRFDVLEQLFLPEFSFAEQERITGFLNSETAQIDTLIAKKERQVELLNEKRAAIISDAIIFGITSIEQLVNAKRIQPKCEFRKLSNLSKIIDCLHQTPEYLDDGYPMVRITDVNGDYLDLSNTKKISEMHFREFTKKYSPKSGDIIISRVGSIGSISLVNDNQKFCLGQNTAAIIPKSNSKYLFYSFQTNFVKDQFELSVVGSTLMTLSLDDIRRLKIPYWAPEKQQAISHFLNIVTTRVDAISGKVRESIDYLKEYRSTLISTAVTGKIDVREEVKA
jgi:type I restriction enzyme S subunit